jgi:hypothetical protein
MQSQTQETVGSLLYHLLTHSKKKKCVVLSMIQSFETRLVFKTSHDMQYGTAVTCPAAIERRDQISGTNCQLISTFMAHFCVKSFGLIQKSLCQISFQS